MAKMKPMAPKSVAKKDNTNVARKRVSAELVGDKPDYSQLNSYNGQSKVTKKDSLDYQVGFRDQITKDKKAGKTTDPDVSLNSFVNQGRLEAWGRREGYLKELNKKALVRDSSIPLAPTQFPD